MEKRLRKWRRRLAIVAILGVFVVAAIYIFRGIPRVAGTALRDAESYELLSLNPERGAGEFHRFAILGRASVTDPAVRKRLYNALHSGAKWNLALRELCFTPRHGIRVTGDGRITDLVICFECSQVQVWQDERHVTTFIVGRSPERVFDKALRDAGLPLAPK